jgi:ribosomal protein L40E
MSTFGTVRNRLSGIKSNLNSLDSQPISKLSLIVIVLLDVFILISIFDGLGRHTQQLASPDDSIPQSCREMVIDRDWNPTNRLDGLSSIILSHRNRTDQIEERRKGLHPVCAPFLGLLDRAKNDKELSALFEDRAAFVREARDLRREIGNLKGAYDTSLLETIAGRKERQADVDSLRKGVQGKSSALNTLVAQIAAAEQKINGNGTVQLLWAKVGSLQPADRDGLRADLRSSYFWYPVKKLGMQLIFLVPIFAIFAFWNGASIRRKRGIQTLVSSHLLIVSFIPILFQVIEAVYDVIPKILLKKLIDLLEALKLVALWHYLVIALAVAAALALLYVLQKKLFSPERLMERRIEKGLCQQCGKHLPPGASACPFCGSAQFRACGACYQPTQVHGRYCRACGKEQA